MISNLLLSIFMGESFITFTIKASLVLIITLVFGKLAKNVPASLRHFVLSMAILLAALIPLSSQILPQWEVIPVPDIGQDNSGHLTTNNAALNLPASDMDIRGLSESNLQRPALQQTGSAWQYAVVFIYLLGAVILIARVIIILIWSRWHIHQGKPLSHKHRRILLMASDSAERAQLKSSISVLISTNLPVPIVCGWLKPTIMLPECAVNWTNDHLKSVFLHEMAHIKRNDEFIATIVQIAAIWQWFNPIFWIALKQFQVEREKACDDFVIMAGIQDTEYADHLIATGQSARSTRCIAFAGVPLAKKESIENRLIDILDRTKNRNNITTRKMFSIGLLILAMIIPLAGLGNESRGNILHEMTSTQEMTIINTVHDFYYALNKGGSFNQVCETFLYEDYFESPHLTLENRDQGDGDYTRKSMTVALHNMQIRLQPLIISRIADVQLETGKCVLRLNSDIVNKNDTGPDTYLARNLTSRIELVKDDGQWKVSRFDDGLSLMQRGAGGGSGPSLLLWVDDLGDYTTPLGALVFDVVPEESRTGSKRYLSLRLEE